MFMRYIGGGIGHVTLGIDQDKTINNEMNIDSEVKEDITNKYDDDGDHQPSQPQALAPGPIVIEDDQEEVGPEAGRDNESESDNELDGDCNNDSDGDCSNND
jgi:hypothetical protein